MTYYISINTNDSLELKYELYDFIENQLKKYNIFPYYHLVVDKTFVNLCTMDDSRIIARVEGDDYEGLPHQEESIRLDIVEVIKEQDRKQYYATLTLEIYLFYRYLQGCSRIYLEPRPLDTKTTVEFLVKWYEKKGFEIDPNYHSRMIINLKEKYKNYR